MTVRLLIQNHTKAEMSVSLLSGGHLSIVHIILVSFEECYQQRLFFHVKLSRIFRVMSTALDVKYLTNIFFHIVSIVNSFNSLSSEMIIKEIRVNSIMVKLHKIFLN
jgi:hypothetical protein